MQTKKYELTKKLGLNKYIRARKIYDLLSETRGTFSVFDDVNDEEIQILEFIYNLAGKFNVRELQKLGHKKEKLKEMTKKGFSIFEDSDHYIDFTCTASRCVF